MTEATRIKASRYIHWAKTYPHVRFDLATSAVMPCPVDELPFEKSDIEINARGAYGYEPLIREIASKFNADPRCVVHSNGTSMANHLAMATILEREDEVLIEKPAYEPLVSLAHYLGANVKRFERREEGNFGIDVSELERLVSSRTRLIVINTPHNPTGGMLKPSDLDAIAERLLAKVRRSSVQRLCIDGLDGLRDAAARPERLAAFFMALIYGLSSEGVTTYVALEVPDLFGPAVQLPVHGIGEVIDTLLFMRHVELRSQLYRTVGQHPEVQVQPAL